MVLYLLRHADASSIFSTKVDDFDRTISGEGHDQIQTLKAKLESLDFRPQSILCSPSKRTKTTCEELLVDRADDLVIELFPEMYNATHRSLLNILCSQRSSGDILMVGHNFGISDLANYLLDDTSVIMNTCELVQIQVNVDSWAELSFGTGNLLARY